MQLILKYDICNDVPRTDSGMDTDEFIISSSFWKTFNQTVINAAGQQLSYQWNPQW